MSINKKKEADYINTRVLLVDAFGDSYLVNSKTGEVYWFFDTSLKDDKGAKVYLYEAKYAHKPYMRLHVHDHTSLYLQYHPAIEGGNEGVTMDEEGLRTFVQAHDAQVVFQPQWELVSREHTIPGLHEKEEITISKRSFEITANSGHWSMRHTIFQGSVLNKTTGITTECRTYQTIDMNGFIDVAAERYNINCFINKTMRDLKLHRSILLDLNNRVVMCTDEPVPGEKIFKGLLDGSDVDVEIFERKKDFAVTYEILQRLRGGNNLANFIVGCYDEKRDSYLLAFEPSYFSSMLTLAMRVKQPFWTNISWDTRLKMISNIIKGLKSIESKSLSHTELSPFNILIDNEMNVKLAGLKGCENMTVASKAREKYCLGKVMLFIATDGRSGFNHGEIDDIAGALACIPKEMAELRSVIEDLLKVEERDRLRPTPGAVCMRIGMWDSEKIIRFICVLSDTLVTLGEYTWYKRINDWYDLPEVDEDGNFDFVKGFCERQFAAMEKNRNDLEKKRNQTSQNEPVQPLIEVNYNRDEVTGLIRFIRNYQHHPEAHPEPEDGVDSLEDVVDSFEDGVDSLEDVVDSFGGTDELLVGTFRRGFPGLLQVLYDAAVHLTKKPLPKRLKYNAKAIEQVKRLKDILFKEKL